MHNTLVRVLLYNDCSTRLKFCNRSIMPNLVLLFTASQYCLCFDVSMVLEVICNLLYVTCVGFIDVIVVPTYEVMGNMIDLIMSSFKKSCKENGNSPQYDADFKPWTTCLNNNKKQWKERCSTKRKQFLIVNNIFFYIIV